jgi:pimeloyl-CoA synthetase
MKEKFPSDFRVIQKKSFRRVEETMSNGFNRNTYKNVGTFQFMQVKKKNITKYVVVCNFQRNV